MKEIENENFALIFLLLTLSNCLLKQYSTYNINFSLILFTTKCKDNTWYMATLCGILLI